MKSVLTKIDFYIKSSPQPAFQKRNPPVRGEDMRRLILAAIAIVAGVFILDAHAFAHAESDGATNGCTWRCVGIAEVIPSGDIECHGDLTATNCKVSRPVSGLAIIYANSYPLDAACAVSPIGLGQHR
jgi:hypothetical protein